MPSSLCLLLSAFFAVPSSQCLLHNYFFKCLIHITFFTVPSLQCLLHSALFTVPSSQFPPFTFSPHTRPFTLANNVISALSIFERFSEFYFGILRCKLEFVTGMSRRWCRKYPAKIKTLTTTTLTSAPLRQIKVPALWMGTWRTRVWVELKLKANYDIFLAVD